MARSKPGADQSGIRWKQFLGCSGKETLERISSEEFFNGFEQNNLAFLYQNQTGDGRQSRFSKLIDRNSAEAAKSAGR
jgi:hypothetical protein